MDQDAMVKVELKIDKSIRINQPGCSYLGICEGSAGDLGIREFNGTQMLELFLVETSVA